jgi:hypothetical protein
VGCCTIPEAYLSKRVILSRILIINDEVSVRSMLRRVLEEAGHTVLETSSLPRVSEGFPCRRML